ncbi:MAG: hypothetical protein ABSE82_05770 [Nitrososphaerales archaeon]|jgi:hypothetical protein
MLAEEKLSPKELSTKSKLDLHEVQSLATALARKGLVSGTPDEISTPIRITDFGRGIIGAHDSLC